MGLRQPADWEASASMECFSHLVVASRRKVRCWTNRLAHLPAQLLNAAKRTRHGSKSSAGVAASRGHSHHDEHLHTRGAGSSATGQQQGGQYPASGAENSMNMGSSSLTAPLCSLVILQLTERQGGYGGSVWESNPPPVPRRNGSPALKAGRVTGPLSPPPQL